MINKSELTNFKIEELPREIMLAMAKSVVPYYSVFEDPIIKKAGRYTGGFHDKWDWNDLDQLTDAELVHVYITCKQSWNSANENIWTK